MSARDRVLSAVRAALADLPAADPGQIEAEHAALPREYRRDRSPDAQTVDLFVERVEDYKAEVRRVNEAGLPALVAEILQSWGVQRVGVPAALPQRWLTAVDAAVDIVRDDSSLSPDVLDSFDAAVTGAELGIAETGTFVLASGGEQGRRALTLVPDRHLCVLWAQDVVASVPEAMARLAPTRPLTFVSGPSATSDIELSRVEGVHGPRTLAVVVVDRASP